MGGTIYTSISAHIQKQTNQIQASQSWQSDFNNCALWTANQTMNKMNTNLRFKGVKHKEQIAASMT